MSAEPSSTMSFRLSSEQLAEVELAQREVREGKIATDAEMAEVWQIFEFPLRPRGRRGRPVHALFAREPEGANREERLAGSSVRWVF